MGSLQPATCAARLGLSEELNVDIVADDLMLDFKTTRSDRHILADVRQMLGYLLLDADDEFGVRWIVKRCRGRPSSRRSMRSACPRVSDALFDGPRPVTPLGLPASSSTRLRHA